MKGHKTSLSSIWKIIFHPEILVQEARLISAIKKQENVNTAAHQGGLVCEIKAAQGVTMVTKVNSHLSSDYQLKCNPATITHDGTKISPRQVDPRLRDSPSRPCDTPLKISVAARPPLTTVAQMRT
jgi:hypothetical protein